MRIIPLRCRRPVKRTDLAAYPDHQVVTPALVAGRGHLEFAVSQAEAAFSRGENISEDLFVEIILRASAQRQIKRAIESFGVCDEGDDEVVVLSEQGPGLFMEDFGCEEVEELLEIDREKMERIKRTFDISDEELSTLPMEKEKALLEVVKERIALLGA
jgi:KEOPS complex subunit Cgi121